MSSGACASAPKARETHGCTERERGDLSGEAAEPEREGEPRDGERESRAIGREGAPHREHRQEHDGDGDELEAVHPSGTGHVRRADDERQRRHQGRGREREAEPRSDRARDAGPVGADRHAELTRHRARQQVRHGDELRELLVRDPAPARDVLLPEVADVRDRATERRRPEPERRREDRQRVAPGFQSGSSRSAIAFAVRDRMKRRSESRFR